MTFTRDTFSLRSAFSFPDIYVDRLKTFKQPQSTEYDILYIARNAVHLGYYTTLIAPHEFARLVKTRKLYRTNAANITKARRGLNTIYYILPKIFFLTMAWPYL